MLQKSQRRTEMSALRPLDVFATLRLSLVPCAEGSKTLERVITTSLTSFSQQSSVAIFFYLQ